MRSAKRRTAGGRAPVCGFHKWYPALRLQSGQIPREQRRLPHIFLTEQLHRQALHTDTESSMRRHALFEGIQVHLLIVQGFYSYQSLFLQSNDQLLLL